MGSIWQALGGRLGPHRLLKLLFMYPPYLGAGVRVREISPDLTRIEVEMPLRAWNRNYVGTHFGGSLYSMADPWFMLILMQNLGRDHVVWDRSASIDFVRPGRGTVRARFEISRERIEEIRRQAEGGEKVEPVFRTRIVDDAGETVAELEKRLYVRRKRAA